MDRYESCSLETIKNSITKYTKMGLVEVKVVSKKEILVSVEPSVEKLGELETHLKNFLKNIYHSALASPVELAKNTGVNLNYLSRL